MGGFGSGRNGGKRCADDLRQIDIRRLSRDGYLKAGMSYGWRLCMLALTPAGLPVSAGN